MASITIITWPNKIMVVKKTDNVKGLQETVLTQNTQSNILKCTEIYIFFFKEMSICNVIISENVNDLSFRLCVLSLSQNMNLFFQKLTNKNLTPFSKHFTKISTYIIL